MRLLSSRGLCVVYCSLDLPGTSKIFLVLGSYFSLSNRTPGIRSACLMPTHGIVSCASLWRRLCGCWSKICWRNFGVLWPCGTVGPAFLCYDFYNDDEQTQTNSMRRAVKKQRISCPRGRKAKHNDPFTIPCTFLCGDGSRRNDLCAHVLPIDAVVWSITNKLR